MRSKWISLTACVTSCLIGLVGSMPASAQEATPHVSEMVAAAETMSFEPVLQADVDHIPPPPSVIGLTIVTLAPDARLEVIIPGPEIYAVQAGVVTLTVAGSAEIMRETEPDDTRASDANAENSYILRPGDQAIIGMDTPHTLVNEEDEPVVLTNVVIFPAAYLAPSRLPTPQMPPGVMVQDLAVGIAAEPLELMTKPLEIAVERAMLDPDAMLPLPEVTEYGLLAIASGHLDVVKGQDERQRVLGGDVVPLEPGASTVAHSADDLPAVIFVLTIRSAEDGISTPESPPTVD